MSLQENKSSWWMRIWYFIRFMLILAVLTGVGYGILFKTDVFIIKDIEIACNNEHTMALFNSFTDHFEGKNIFLISMAEAVEELENNPYVAQLEVTRSFPDKIKYRAIMREEKAAFLYNNMYLYLDGDGMLLRISPENEGAFVLEGFTVKSFIVGRPLELNTPEELANALKLINLVAQTSFDQPPKVVYEKKQITLRLNDQLKGKFGNGEEIERKFNAFMDIYKDLKVKGITSGVVDVSHKGYPVYKPFGE